MAKYKTKKSQLDAVRGYRERKKQDGHYFYTRLIKKEFAPILDNIINALKARDV